MAFSCFIKSVIAKSANREMKDARFYISKINQHIISLFRSGIICDNKESIIVQASSIQFDNRSKSDTLYNQSLNNYYNNTTRSTDETI